VCKREGEEETGEKVYLHTGYRQKSEESDANRQHMIGGGEGKKKSVNTIFWIEGDYLDMRKGGRIT